MALPPRSPGTRWAQRPEVGRDEVNELVFTHSALSDTKPGQDTARAQRVRHVGLITCLLKLLRPKYTKHQ